MATNNCVNVDITTPIPVTKGGTGKTSFTDNLLIIGNTSSELTTIPDPGSNYKILGSYYSVPSFNLYIPSNLASVTTTFAANSAITRTFTISNSDTTSADASAAFSFSVEGSSSVKWNVGTTYFLNTISALGASAGHYFINSSSATCMDINYDGAAIKPAQPASSIYVNSTLSDISGDGTAYKVAYNTAIFNTQSSYSTGSYEFTAPVTGRYAVSATVAYRPAVGGSNVYDLDIITSNRTYKAFTFPTRNTIANFSGPSYVFNPALTALIDMDEGDIVYIQAKGSGGAKTDDIVETSNPNNITWFECILVC